MVNNFDKYLLLMWKNWTLLKRRPIHTAFEILYPGLVCLILVGLRSVISPDERPEMIYSPFNISESGGSSISNDYTLYLFTILVEYKIIIFFWQKKSCGVLLS
jgi:hypothetical protein